MKKGRKDEEDVAVKTVVTGVLTWKCPACGAFNDDSQQICAECTAIRAGAPSIPKAPEVEKDDWEAPLSKEAAPDSLDEAEDENKAEELEEPEVENTEVEPEPATPSPESPFTSPFTTPFSAPSSTPTATGQTRYYLTFVNSPAQSLIKSKVSIDFDLFDVISIGRNPENVVVVPDAEVSRKHAELTLQGNKLILKDLKSKNGTYLYNGKQFEQVSDSVEVKPNSLIKFGTGTIVRLTSE